MGAMVGSILLLCGTLTFALGIWLLLDARAFVARAVTAEAVVTELARDSRNRAAAVFSFDLQDGRRGRATHGVWSNPPVYAVGDRVTLRYDPAQPDRAAPATPFWTYGLPAIVILFGGGFAAIGLYTLRRRRRAT